VFIGWRFGMETYVAWQINDCEAAGI
jgi:hypothetical protein